MLYNLVIIDDEIRIRHGIKQTFPWEEMGFQVVADFDSSLRALEYISTNAVDIVLTDIKMPIMDGIELAQKIKALNERVEIIFISGYRDFSYAKSAISIGIKDYITKPINREELMTLFERVKADLDRQNADALQMQDESNLPYYDKIIQEIKSYVANNLASVTLETAAMQVGFSSGYLSKLFKQKTDSNFSDYVLKVKMEKAILLLDDPLLKSYNIAALVGYDNPKNFSRSFKQYYGISPREYREKGLKGGLS